MPDSSFALLRDLIHERTGLFYDREKRDLLAEKLSQRVADRGFSSFLDYYYLLKYDEAAASEWLKVMDLLSVPETFFWREFDQLRALVDTIIPEHAARCPDTPFRIWSAACCSGEEPLSIALALEEAGAFARCPIEITATDASPLAIERSRRGFYRERSFRVMPPHLRAKYFTQTDDGWMVNPSIKSRVSYSTLNLLQPEMLRHAQVHATFCRNVFIYFSPETIRKTVQRFYGQMLAPAWLFLGASESLLKLDTPFQLREINGAFVYVKE